MTKGADDQANICFESLYDRNIQNSAFWAWKCDRKEFTHHEFPFLACAKKLSCGLKRKCWLGKMLYRKRAKQRILIEKSTQFNDMIDLGIEEEKSWQKRDHLSSNDVQSKTRKLKLL